MTATDIVKLWAEASIKESLAATSKLLNSLATSEFTARNDALNAQHALSRGIEILVSIQRYLCAGSNYSEAVTKNGKSLDETAGILEETVPLLSKHHNPKFLDRTVLSSWHLHRNTFVKDLKIIDTPEEKWTKVLRAVVQADDYYWAARLVDETHKTIQDNVTDGHLKEILTKLEEETPATQDEEDIRTDRVLAIMCMNDEATRASKALNLDGAFKLESASEVGSDVKEVVKDMAESKDSSKWTTLSGKLRELRVCRYVEKALNVYEGKYPLPFIMADTEGEVTDANEGLTKTITFGQDKAQITGEKAEPVKVHLTEIERTMQASTIHLTMVAKKKNGAEKSEEQDSKISYNALRMLTLTAFAITPVRGVNELNEFEQRIVKSVSEFIQGLGGFNLLTGWTSLFRQELANTSEIIKNFGLSKVDPGASK